MQVIKSLSVVDQMGNAGGGSRFIRCLLPALKKIRPDMQITFFCNKSSILRDQLYHELVESGIIVDHLHTGIIQMAHFANLIMNKLYFQYRKQPYLLAYSLLKLLKCEVEKKASNFDLVYFPWPFLMLCPSLQRPMVATFHDFNFRYYFAGKFTFNPFQQYLLDHETPVWLERTVPVVSTHFMGSELKNFYPEYASKTEVIHLASMSSKTTISDEDARRIVSNTFNITGDYILYPTNTCSHKNLGPLIQSMSLLQEMNRDIKLILTGPDTKRIRGRSSKIGIELGEKEQNVIGLGYVSNMQMDALIQCAKAVVSSSLYEAGNGPGVDAWERAIPVAMSNIRPFLEHVEMQGVKAQVFDPWSPRDIAHKVDALLSDPQKANEHALDSQRAMKKITWEKVAENYMNVFNKAFREGIK